MKPPEFWQRGGLMPALLAPAASLVAASTRRRVNRPGWRAPVPVLCCGNASVGGAGKTIVVLDLIRRLRRRGVAVHCLTRGYGGRVEGVMRVDPGRHAAALVGDEPLLLAAEAPTWVGADRAASAREAVEAGAELLLMDDGLQNPGLTKTASLLIVDGAVGFGNGRVMPAGPLRETVGDAVARCLASVLIGVDTASARKAMGDLPVLDAWLVPDRALDGMRAFAFCGIGRPGKFFETVAAAGAELAGSRSFPDHHTFSPQEIGQVMSAAARIGAQPITTAKDAVRLPGEVRARVEVLGVRLMWREEAALESLLDEVVA
jgi:tetraacyldisaccharide 4'-kinase